MKCVKCGKQIADGSTFCQFCGANQDAQPNAVPCDNESVCASESAEEVLESKPGKKLSTPDFIVYEWSKSNPISKISNVFGAIVGITVLILIIISLVAAIKPDLYLQLFNGITEEMILIWLPVFLSGFTCVIVATRWVSDLLELLSVISLSKHLKAKDDEIDYLASIQRYGTKSMQKRNIELFGNALAVKEKSGMIAPHAVYFAIKTLCHLVIVISSYFFFNTAFSGWMLLVLGNFVGSFAKLTGSFSSNLFVGAVIVQILAHIVCGAIINSNRKKLFKNAREGNYGA